MVIPVWLGGWSNRSLVVVLLLLIQASGFAAETNFPAVYNTEKSKEVLSSPTEAVKKFALPKGFTATLFAGEPDVQQPIAMTFDPRGRLWVVENYTYAESEVNFEKKLRDRIVIFEDSDHDGHFDSRKVFWDQGQHATSVAIGFGGVWVLAAPQMLFIPDRNGDDIPDGEPEVVLDGWNADIVRHNIVNGLMWGPDGWLYGRHGILATSLVGKPGTPKDDRTQINCGIWRYHPTKKIFEVVAHGTTNPWGMDFDDYGEGFFINTVIGHLWHVIPGAHYRRMFGEDFNVHTYNLIEQHADHFHWDTGKSWTESRGGRGVNDILGGGHAHSGLMFYLGDNWPQRYRNTLFTINLHGMRLNNDIIEPSGCGYVGKHGEDILKTSDVWFRGIDLINGPDGGVYLADWSDVGECHESDGVHRTSGRIYRFTYGKPSAPSVTNVAGLNENALVDLQLSKNEWLVRQARLVLQQRASAGTNMVAAHNALRKIYEENPDVTRQLRALWALHVTGGAPEAWELAQLNHTNEHVRAWAVRLASDTGVSDAAAGRFTEIARTEQSGLVRLYLASALQKIATGKRWELAAALLSHGEDANDHNQPLMLWYGIEPLGATNGTRLVSLARASKIPLVTTYIARLITEDIEKKPQPVDILIKLAASSSEEFQIAALQGMREAMHGWRKATPPASWRLMQGKMASSNRKLQESALELGLVFGDPRALEELRKIALDEKSEVEWRRSALEKLIAKKPDNLLTMLQTLATNRALASVAVRGLAAFDDPKTPDLLINSYQSFSPQERPDVISTLSSRPVYANALLDAVSAGKINRADISAYHVRQIRSFGNEPLNQKLKTVWGEIRGTGAEKKELIAKYKTLLSPNRIKYASPSKGRALYKQSCGLCHTLFGEGGKVGPDLTGSGRSNVDYLLENVVDPNAIVGADFRVSTVALKDGRVLNGIIKNQTDRTLTIQSFTEALTVERSEVTEIKQESSSLMPEGLLEGLQDDQIANLIAYLMSPQQVPLPDEAK